MAQQICIKTYTNRSEAEMALELLRKNGIQAFVTADDVGGMEPHFLQTVYSARLMVDVKDKKKAETFLK